ncbi:hypothetical protein [Roseburia sp. 1XD42-69]|uniref:hypothetical protein n=1 Tax=Roseburia sp. 1XD42-69 TaxID=2320088 RepID=UPI0018F58A39|nr:hypothetical protein [Roseburia sp. 1XD42-69]
MSDKILLVDDKTEIADLAEVYLRNENYEVLKYYSPKDVLAHIGEIQPEPVEQGNFEQHVPFQPEDTLYVNRCELIYLYDTKGFYQPAYQFGGPINNNENPWTCRILLWQNKR